MTEAPHGMSPPDAAGADAAGAEDAPVTSPPEARTATSSEPQAAPKPERVSNWPMWMLGLVTLVDQLDQNIIRGIENELQKDFGISDLQLGILLSSFIFVNGIVTVPAGYLADRWRRTRTIGNTVVGWSGLTFLTAFMPNFGSMLAVRSSLGFGQAITEPAAASLLGDYYEVDRRGRAFSIQLVCMIGGVGLGIAFGGIFAATVGWRWAYAVVGPLGGLIAILAYRMNEPVRGQADRSYAGVEETHEEVVHPPLFEHGMRRFAVDMLRGLRDDLKTIFGIRSMRYALAGVMGLMFTMNAVGSWFVQFYERSYGLTHFEGTMALAAIILFGGVPGILLGGKIADHYATRIKGARMAIPGYCLLAGASLLTISYVVEVFAVSWLFAWGGFTGVALAGPALRASLSDAVPHNLRGAGFGAFNLVAMTLGGASAPIVVSVLSEIFDNNLRTAFLIVTPPVMIAAGLLLRARHFLDEDMGKIFEAIYKAVQEQQREAEESAPG